MSTINHGRDSIKYQRESGSSEAPILQPLLQIQGRNNNETSNSKGFFNAAKSMAGAGSLTLPYAFSLGGSVLSILLICLVALVNFYDCYILSKLHEEYSRIRFIDEKYHNPYARLGKVIFGTSAFSIINFLYFINTGGACIAYLIFIETTMGTVTQVVPEYVWVLASITILIPLSWFKSLKFLAIPSLIGNVAIIISYTIVLIYGCIEYPPELERKDLAVQWKSIPEFFGLILFSFSVPMISLTIYEEMKEKQKYNLIIFLSCLTVTSFYIFIGLFGFSTFHQAEGGVKGNIMLNLPNGSIMTTIVQVCMSLVLLFTFPLIHFLLSSSIEAYLVKEDQDFRRYFIRTFLVILAALIAIFFPSFNDVISIVGIFAASLLSFFFPPILYLKGFWRDLSIFQILFNSLLALFGIFLWAACTTSLIIGLVKSDVP